MSERKCPKCDGNASEIGNENVTVSYVCDECWYMWEAE